MKSSNAALQPRTDEETVSQTETIINYRSVILVYGRLCRSYATNQLNSGRKSPSSICLMKMTFSASWSNPHNTS